MAGPLPPRLGGRAPGAGEVAADRLPEPRFGAQPLAHGAPADRPRAVAKLAGLARQRDASARLIDLTSRGAAGRPLSRRQSRAACPAGSSSGSPSPAPLPAIPGSWSATSRPRRSTFRCRRRSSICWRICRPAAGQLHLHLARSRRRALPVRPDRGALSRPDDGDRTGRAGLCGPASSLYRGAAVGGARHRRPAPATASGFTARFRARVKPPPRLRLPHPLPAQARARSAKARSRRCTRPSRGHVIRCHIPAAELMIASE